MENEKTVLYLIKSNGKQQTPKDKQKTILKIKLKNSFRNETEKPKEKKKRNVILERKQFFDCITKNLLERIGTLK